MGRRARPAGSFWPSTTQALLLRAALAPPDQGLAAWRDLGPAFELRTLESGTISALPLVYRNLRQTLPDDPRLPHLKGIVRNCWVRNRLLSEQLAAIVTAFDADGIRAVLFDSLAAAVRYYDELGLRPTPALDFLIARGNLPAAMRILGRLGFSASGPSPGGEGPLLMVNAGQGQTAVLRTTAAVELTLGIEDVLERSQPVEVGRCTVQAADPADDLLVACTAGARVKDVRSIQWLVDMARISAVGMSGARWNQLWTLAGEQGQTLRLRKSLDYLEGVVGMAPAPRGDLPGESRRERIAYRCAGVSVPGLGSLPQAIGEYLTATRDSSRWRTVASFPGFLQRRWTLASRRQIPAAAAQRIAGALQRSRKRAA